MSDVITLASFEFDDSKINKSIDDLNKKFLELQKAQQANKAEASLLNKEYAALKQAQDGLTKAGAQSSQAYKDNAKALAEVEAKQLATFKAMQATATQTAVVRSELNSLTNIQRTRLTVEGQQLSLSQAIEQARGREINNINDARKAIADLTKLRNQLNPAIAEEAQLIKELNEEIDQNNEFVRENASAMEQQKMNIGNYQSALQGLSPTLGGFVNDLQGAYANLRNVKDALVAQSAAMVGSTAATSGTSKALNLFKIALVSTGIGAIVVLLGSLVTYLTTTQAGIDKVTAVTRPLQAVFQSLLGLFQNVGKSLFEAFSNPKQLLSDLADFVKSQLINRFKAFGVILDGIVNLDFKKVADGVLQAGTGVENATDKIKSAAKATGDFLDEAVKKGQELDRLEKELEKTRIRNKTAIGALTEEIKAQNAIAEDQNKTLKQREDAAAASIVAAKNLNALKQKELDLEIAILRNKQSRNDTSRAEEEQLAELIAKKNEANAQELELVTTQNNKLNAIRKEALAKQAEELAKAQEAQLKKMNEELDLFIEQQGFKEKSLEEELTVLRQTSEKRKAILDAELKFGKISRTKYNTEILALQNELGQKTAELTVQNAELELQEFLRLNDEKYLENKRLSDELVALETNRLETEQAKRAEFAALQLAQGVIDKTEYNAQMLALDQEYEDKKTELVKNAEQIRAEDEAMRRELQKEAELLALNDDMWASFEARQINADAQYALEQENLKQQREQGLISEDNFLKAKQNLEQGYAKASDEIERLRNEYKLQVASQTFGNLAKIAGEESAAGKAFAVAQTTIDTYQAATAAYKSLAGIPVVGPALGAIAAAAAVASGIANVKKITSTKTPNVSGSSGIQGLATGGEVKGGLPITRSNGDDRLITAKTGEVILTNSQRSFIGDELLGLAGVPGFATGGMVGGRTIGTASQASSVASLETASLSTMIASAVEQGAQRGAQAGSERGSQKGLGDLADNRSIQNMASF